MGEKKQVQFDYDDGKGTRFSGMVPLDEEQFLLAAQQSAAQLLLQSSIQMKCAGENPTDAFRLGAYLVLVTAYGRAWVRQTFGIAERTESRWWARVRDAVRDQPEEPDKEMLDLAVSASLAFQKLRNQGRLNGPAVVSDDEGD